MSTKDYRLKTLFLTVIFLLFIHISLNAQNDNDERTVGLSALIQNSQADILLPIWISNSSIIAPAFGVLYMNNGFTDLALGIVTRFYLKNGVFAPFIGGRGGVLLAMRENADTISDFILGFLGGGEYFFDTHFSMGVEAQLNLSISDKNSSRFGNPDGININTGAAVFATVYF